MKKMHYLFLAILCSSQALLHAQQKEASQYKAATGFYENKGQITDQDHKPNPAVKYLLHNPGFNVQLRQTGFSYDTYTETTEPSPSNGHEALSGKIAQPKNSIRHYHRVDVEFVGCNPDAVITSDGRSESYYNYITADGGVSDVHCYQKVTYQNIYPAIDLEFSYDRRNNNGNGPEYNFIVHPGGNPANIKLEYKGANKMKLENEGLAINVDAGDFSENIPSSYIKDTKQPVQVHYTDVGNNVFSFSVPSFTAHLTSDLIIDPVPNLAWGTYYGGTADDYGNAIKLDAANNVYITGFSASASGIATSGAYKTTLTGGYNALIAKFNPTGSSLLWATYYGYGVWPNDVANDLALDAGGNIYITGRTTSPGMATTGTYQTTVCGCFSNAFVAKFNPTGTSLLWGTYYGGSNEAGGIAITLDASDNVYITGYTRGSGGVTTVGAYQTGYGGGYYNAFVAKFNPTGTSLLWGTYYGGGNDTYGQAIAVDAAGNVYITGANQVGYSATATAGAYQTTYGGGPEDAYVAKFNASGSSLLWGTYYGGTGDDAADGIALDASGNVYITGHTSSPGMTTPGAYQTTIAGGASNTFVAKFNASGSSLLSGTYYGGTGTDQGTGIVLDASNNIYITGITTSTSGIATAGAYQTIYGGGANDAFLAKFNPTVSSLIMGTYYGGTGDDRGMGIVLDAGNNVFITGYGASTSGIATPGAYQPTYGGGPFDAFVAKFDITLPPITGTPLVCVGATTTLSDAIPGGAWSSSSIAIAKVGSTGIVTGMASGSAVITYTYAGATATMTVSVSATMPAIVAMTGGGGYCPGGTGVNVGLAGSAVGINYQLYCSGSPVGSPVPGIGMALNFGPQTVAGVYTATAINPASTCASTMSGSKTVTVYPSIAAFAVTGGGTVCPKGYGAPIGLSGSAPGISYKLYLGGTPTGISIPGTGASLSFGAFTTAGAYTITATNPVYGCVANMTGSATITLSSPSISGGGSTLSPGTVTTLTGSPAGGTWSSSAPSVATVGSATGVVTGVMAGTTVISYTLPSDCAATTIVYVSLYSKSSRQAPVSGNGDPANELLLTPNPNTGTFSIKGSLPDAPGNEQASLKIADMAGRAIWARDVTVNNGELDETISLNNIASGIYLLSIRTNGDQKIFKVIVAR